MLSPGEIARITANIERLEKARDQCADSGIRKLIEAWIEEQKQKLASGKNPKPHIITITITAGLPGSHK